MNNNFRPNLTKDISINDFKNFYWLKKELQSFCKENNISTYGSKLEIAERIEIFLSTGVIKEPIKRKSTKKNKNEILTLDTVITENHYCSQSVRFFFKTIIPNFHFSTFIQNYFKENIGKTYRDVIDAWNEEELRRKDKSYKKKIGKQFEYNQFIRDFFADEKNKNKTRQDAINAWNEIKKIPGDNKYK